MKRPQILLFVFVLALSLALLIGIATLQAFPQAIAWVWALMLFCWAVHALTWVVLVRALARKHVGAAVLMGIGGGLLAGFALLATIFICSPTPDQAWVATWDDPEGDLHVEIYHLGMWDFTATQVFVGTKSNPFASGYHRQDHFMAGGLEDAGDHLCIPNTSDSDTLVVYKHSGALTHRGA